jgi:putative endonuclease
VNGVYILRCADGSLYTGWTNDVEARIKAHNEGRAGAKYTRSRRPVTLVYWEDCGTKEQAMSREWHIKRLTRAQKLALIAKSLPLEGKVARPVSRKGRDG